MPKVLHSALNMAPTMRAQIFAAFVHSYLSSGSISSSTNFDDRIFRSIGSLPQRSQITERGLSAISCLFLGKANHNSSIFNHGLRLYQTVIRQISNMINQGNYSHDLLHTIFLCQDIDLIYAPNGLRSCASHVAGMSTLLQYYRSESSSDPILNTIYHHQKLRIILATTGMGLSKSEYDYLMEPTNGDPLLEILQTAVAIGDLKSLIESIHSTDLSHPGPIAWNALLQRCYEIQGILMGLEQAGELGKEPHRSSVNPGDDLQILSPQPLFGDAYEFSSPHDALLFVLFWTHLVLLQPLVRRANSLFRSHITSTAGIRTVSHLKFEDLAFVHPEKYADKVARATSYCLQDCMKVSLQNVTTFSLCIISLAYIDTGNRAKHDWCLGAIRAIASRGFDVPSHLAKLMAAQWELRWATGDPNIRTSLREFDFSVCDIDPPPVFDSRGGVECGSMYHSDGPRPAKEISN